MTEKSLRFARFTVLASFVLLVLSLGGSLYEHLVLELEGEFVWHHHDAEDELFLVLRGRLRMELRDPDERAIELGPGELIVVPRGVEHRPVAVGDGCAVLLVEPASTVNTGSASEDPRTRTVLEHL
ncbi:MAG TPA: cupin domain-containing protein [Sandaracinaceae bacterium]